MSRSPALVLLGAVFGLRLVLALTTDGYLGVDGGAYMLSALRVMGLEATGTDFDRPPLAPGWLLVPFIQIFGNTTGFNVYAAVFSMPLVIVAWTVARLLMGTLAGYAMILLVGFDWVLMGMVVTGVVPLTGFAFVLLASWGLWRTAERGCDWHTYALALSIPLIALTNQTATGLAAIILPLQWLVLPRKGETLLGLAFGAVFALPVLPYYMDANPASGKLTYPGPIVGIHRITDHQLWIGMFALYVLWTTRRAMGIYGQPLWVRPAVVVVCFLAVLQMFQSHNEVIQNLMFRATYLMMPFFWLVIVYFYMPRAVRWFREYHKAPVVAAAALILFVGVAAQQFMDQRWLSSFGDEAIVETARTVPADAGKVVTNAYSMALFVAAEAQKPVLWTNYIAPPPAYEQADMDARCTLGWQPGCGPASGVTHVLVDEKWPILHPLFPQRVPYGAPPDAPWDFSKVPWLRLIHEQGTTKLYEVTI